MINKCLFGYMLAWSVIWGLDCLYDLFNPVNIPKLLLILIMWQFVGEKK